MRDRRTPNAIRLHEMTREMSDDDVVSVLVKYPEDVDAVRSFMRSIPFHRALVLLHKVHAQNYEKFRAYKQCITDAQCTIPSFSSMPRELTDALRDATFMEAFPPKSDPAFDTCFSALSRAFAELETPNASEFAFVIPGPVTPHASSSTYHTQHSSQHSSRQRVRPAIKKRQLRR